MWTNSAWAIVLSNKFLYDGWNLVAELNATNNNVIRSYAWGLDLSGTEQGAGGVGGLLVVKQAGGARQFSPYDGNGYVMGLYDPAATNWVARYEYGPFGETVRASGTAATTNPFRFSTKYTDDETDLLHCGYRYVNTFTGRWLSWDPAKEQEGGPNVYGYVGNNAVGQVDDLGMAFYAVDGTSAYAGKRANPWQLYQETK